jgi:hypothetical protein
MVHWQEDIVEFCLVYITVIGLYNSAAVQVWHIVATAAGTDILACFIMQNEEWCCVQENEAEAREGKNSCLTVYQHYIKIVPNSTNIAVCIACVRLFLSFRGNHE